MDVGVVGLGQMGVGMASNLLDRGHRVTVWNRTPVKADALVARGAVHAASPAEAAACGLVVSMLADDAAVEAATFGDDGILAGLPGDGIHLGASTVGLPLVERLAAAHGDAGRHFLATPVFGRPPVAAKGELWIVTSGPAAVIERARPILADMGRALFEVGEAPAAAAVAKLAGNFMLFAATEAMAEAMVLAERHGLPRDKLLGVLTGSLFDAPVYRNYGATLVSKAWRPAGFAAPLGLKDMRLAGDAAMAVGVPMPLLDLIQQHLAEAIALEGPDVDAAGIGIAVEAAATSA